jgi:hypothetical protein
MDAQATLTAHVTVTFLRMDRAPVVPPSPLPADCRLERVPACTVGFYRYLYGTVGRDWVWWLRRTVPDEDLAALLRDPAISIHVLTRGGEPAGFFEIDRRRVPDSNISYFGLLPHAIGQGLGRAFLEHAVAEAWHGGPRAVTVNTCTADHPRALPNYLAAGFRRVREVKERWDVPATLGLSVPERLRAG